MRRTSVCLVLLGLLLLMSSAVAASAQAATEWNVRSSGGQLEGNVHRLAGEPGYFDVDDAASKLLGGLEANGLVMSVDGSVFGRAVRIDANSAVLHRSPSKTSPIVGEVRLRGGRWTARRLAGGTWRRVGTIQGGCPGRAAVAAMRVLLW